MKRFFAVILALVLTAGVFALADAPDLSSLSNADLLSLYDSVRAEMNRRGLTSVKSLPEGKYIIGEDILPGKYKITCTSTEGEEVGSTYASLGSVYGALLGDEWKDLMGSLGGAMESLSGASIKVLGDYGTTLKKLELKTGESTVLTLNAGTALEISDGSVELEAE